MGNQSCRQRRRNHGRRPIRGSHKSVSHSPLVRKVARGITQGPGIRVGYSDAAEDAVSQIKRSQGRHKANGQKCQTKHGSSNHHRLLGVAAINELSRENHGDRCDRGADRERQRDLHRAPASRFR